MKTRELFVPDRHAIAITSMTRIGDKIYLGLTAAANALAVYDIAQDELRMEPELFPWVKGRGYCSKIHNAMGALADGSILLGEGNHFTWDGIPVTVNYFNRELPESMLARKRAQGWPDVRYTDFCRENLEGWDRTRTDPGGKILRYNPATQSASLVGHLPPFLYAQSMVVDAARGVAFGHTLPDNHFFFVDVQAGSVRDFGHISDYAHHNMVVTPAGICYGGWIDRADGSLKLLRFDPRLQRLEYLNTTILREVGAKVAGNQGIDSWLVTRSGRIYMGTVAKSMLCEFHPETEEFELVAELSRGGRVTSMDEDDAGVIWIGADYPHMRLIRFDPSETGKARLTDCGPVNSTYARCYFHASCCFDGRLYLGETDGFSPSLHIVDLTSIA
jgi:hypothetical protein